MCGRFSLAVGPDELREAFGLSEVPSDLVPRYNLAPTQPVLIVTGEDPAVAVWARWGLVPRWAKDPRIGSRLINARSESVAEKPSFRDAFRRRRCLVLADGFYEWRAGPQGKRPFHFRLRNGRAFAFAGLWETWQPPEGEPWRSCTILTTEAQEPVAAIHDRMPVLLPAALRSEWPSTTASPTTVLARALQQRVSKALEGYEVSPLVNSPGHDDPSCREPLSQSGDEPS